MRYAVRIPSSLILAWHRVLIVILDTFCSRRMCNVLSSCRPSPVSGSGSSSSTTGVGSAREVCDKRPRDEARDELADGPPDGEHGEQPLVRRGHELEEHGRVDGQVPAHACVPGRDERAERECGGGAPGGEGEDAGDEEGEVE